MFFDEQKLDVLSQHLAAPPSYPLAKLWQELTAGAWRIVAAYSYGEHCFLELERVLAGARSIALCGRGRHIAESVLTGRGQKAIAIELQRSQAAIAAHLAGWLRSLGLPCSASHAPLLLMVAAHAALCPETQRMARLTSYNEGGVDRFVVSATRPDAPLARYLSPMEFTTVQLLLDGLSHAAIAKIRGTSVRTVANQLGAAFRKARVSGRSELLAAVVGGQGARGSVFELQTSRGAA